MEIIELSPSVLAWAASQIGASVGEIAQKISKRSAEDIERGKLGYSQVIQFAKATGVSLDILFLDQPPQPRKLPVADFRTLPEAHPLGRDFYDVFDDIEFKHSWLKERLTAESVDRLNFVGKYNGQFPAVDELADEMRTTLGFDEDDITQLKNPDQLFSHLAEICEGKGIFVFKNGVVGNNTSRPLSVVEFRGFAIADDICPIIFINGSDAPAAWVFTLAHELAHIWLGDSGVSDASPASHNRIEKYCNAVAGEFLVPKATFLNFWEEKPSETVDSRIDDARKRFKVSKVVIARRAYDLDLISKDKYFEVYNLARQATKEKKAGGGDFYKSLATRNSKAFSTQVTELAVTGNITLGQAGRLLNTNPNNVIKLYEKRNAVSI